MKIWFSWKKKLIFTKLGDGKDFFQKYQNQNFESCFSVDYEDSKSYTGEKLFPKSIKIKEKEKLENFLQKPHTFFINDKENKNNKKVVKWETFRTWKITCPATQGMYQRKMTWTQKQLKHAPPIPTAVDANESKKA